MALAGVGPDVSHQFFRALETAHVADDGRERKGVNQAYAEHLHCAEHQGLAADLRGDESLETLATLFRGIQIAEVLGEDLFLDGRPVPLLEDLLTGALQGEVAPSGADGVAVAVGP